MKKNIKNLWAIVCVCMLCLAFEGCASKDWSYKDKNYPNISWFAKSTDIIDETRFKQAAEPLRVLLHVHYMWEGREVRIDPYNVRSADWREAEGLWLASKRYLEETGLFKVVTIEEENIQGKMTINIARNTSEKTKALLAEQKKAFSEKNVYEYDMNMDMTLTVRGKAVLTGEAQTSHMFIGFADSKEKELGQDPEKFTFSYFNTMDFHTEFVRRFYKQMLFECVKQIENDL